MKQGSKTMPNGQQIVTDAPWSKASLLLRLIVPCVLVVFMAPFFALLFYSLPATDDFCKATLSFNSIPQRDVLSVTWMYYTQWSPRWLTTFIQSLVMSHVDLATRYGWLLLSVIITNLVALCYFFRTVFRLPRTTSILAAGVFYAAYVASLTDLQLQLYWLTGATEYNLSFSTLLFLVSLLYLARSDVWYYVLVALLSIAVPAQHEIAGAFLCAFLFAGAVMMRVKRLPARQWYLSLGMAASSQAIVMLSPGNAIRAAQEHKHLWDLAHFPRWVAHSFYHGLNWLSYPAILVAGCSIFLLCQRDQDTPVADELPPQWLGIAGLCAMFALLCEVSFVEMASGVWIPARVIAWFQFVFWMLLICVILKGIPEIHRVRFSLGTRISVFILLGVTLLGSSNFRAAVEDLRGPAQSWWRMNSSRLKQRGGALEFEGPARYPNLAMHQNLDPDPGCFVNKCMANYLRAKTVVVKNTNEECPH
jgi:hypothetical protein